MAQNITLLGANYSAVPGVQLPKTGGGTALFTDVTPTTATAADVASGKIFFDASGAQKTGTNSGGGGGMNVQTYLDYDYVSSTSYTATDVSLTVDVTGTYDIAWMGWRNTTSGTSGTCLYVDNVATGGNHTSFVGSYGQFVTLTGIHLTAGDVVTVRARSRSTSYRMYVGGLVLQQTA